MGRGVCAKAGSHAPASAAGPLSLLLGCPPPAPRLTRGQVRAHVVGHAHSQQRLLDLHAVVRVEVFASVEMRAKTCMLGRWGDSGR